MSGRRPALATVVAAAAFLSGCGGHRAEPRSEPEPLRFSAVANAAGRTGDAVQQGARLSHVLGCAGCHGNDLAGQVWERDPQIGTLFSSNLTRAVPGYSDAELERALRQGIRKDGSPLWEMPSELFNRLSAADMSALIANLRTLSPRGQAHPRPTFGPRGREMMRAGELKSTPRWVRETRSQQSARLDGRHEWARYMIRATCSECHRMTLEGDSTNDDPHFRPPDLAIVGGYSQAQFSHLLRTGEPIGGRQLGLMGEVARSRYSNLTDAEIHAIYDYLKARADRPQ